MAMGMAMGGKAMGGMGMSGGSTMGKTMGGTMGCSAGELRDELEEAILAVWEQQSGLFTGSLDLDDILDSIRITSTTESGGNNVHTVVIEYKPESPIDHLQFIAAAQQAVAAGAITSSYCGCSPLIDITAESAQYNPAGPNALRRGRCRGGFTGRRHEREAAPLVSPARAVAQTAASPVSAVGAAVLVAVVAAAVIVVRISRASSGRVEEEVSEPTGVLINKDGHNQA